MAHSLSEIEYRTRALMAELGMLHLRRPLEEIGWTFRYDRARKRLGACRFSRRKGGPKGISLSALYAERDGWALMEDVARHEIAHALDFETRGKSRHDAAWKQWAVACGADPSRLYEEPLLPPARSKYVGVCPSCGHQTSFFRRPTRRYSCSPCSGQRYNPAFELKLYVRVPRKAA
jgi:hypothetical protein